MIFDKEETKQILNMLRSTDRDNHVIAFETLNNVSLKDYIGELIVMYKYSGHDLKYWQEGCNASIEIFMEYFIKDMTRMLESIGYPTDAFDVNIKLKEDGQTTESK